MNQLITAPNQNWRFTGNFNIISSYEHSFLYQVLCFAIANFG